MGMRGFETCICISIHVLYKVSVGNRNSFTTSSTSSRHRAPPAVFLVPRNKHTHHVTDTRPGKQAPAFFLTFFFRVSKNVHFCLVLNPRVSGLSAHPPETETERDGDDDR